jgi:acyl carrier protein
MSEIKAQIFEEIRDLTGEKSVEITNETPLLGDGSVLDSMKVVSLCLVLEDLAADHEFEFDWTSDAAMSRSRSMFRTAGALADEFLQQMSAKK